MHDDLIELMYPRPDYDDDLTEEAIEHAPDIPSHLKQAYKDHLIDIQRIYDLLNKDENGLWSADRMEFDRQLRDLFPDQDEESLPHDYHESTEVHEKKKRYRRRLILGEADFSYTQAFIKHKRKELEDFDESAFVSSIVSTEFKSEEELKKLYSDFEQNVHALKELNVDIQYGIDATKIHEGKCKKGERFKRIQFNAPFVAGDNAPKKGEITPTAKMLKSFFASAAKVQKEGDRVHVVLVEKTHLDYDKSKGGAGRKFWLGRKYAIVDALGDNYKLIKKRPFVTGRNKVRYEGYKHKEGLQKLSPQKNSTFIKGNGNLKGNCKDCIAIILIIFSHLMTQATVKILLIRRSRKI